GRLATITIDRPEAMNALDPPMLFGLAEAWDRAEEDDDVWVVLITGAGDKAFCVGADLKTTIPATAAIARGEATDPGPRWPRRSPSPPGGGIGPARWQNAGAEKAPWRCGRSRSR